MMRTAGKEEKIFFARVKRMIELRAVLVTALLGLPLLFRIKTFENHWTVMTFYVLIGATCCLSLSYLLYLKKRKISSVFIAIQIGLDLLFETALIAVTGGLGSLFPFLYIITIVASSIFFHQRGGLLMAGMASLLFSLMAFLQQYQLTPFETAVPFEGKEALYALFLYVIAFYTVGGLSGRLSSRLHEKEVRLLNLRVFHEDIVQSIASGLITTNLSGVITSINRSATKITGFKPEDIIGMRWEQAFGWTDLEQHFLKLKETGISQRFEGEIVHPSGNHALLGVTISALQGEQSGVIGTFQDLTQIRNLEEEMQKKERLATIGEMAAGMAHEIRNPLASLSGSLQVLKNELPLVGENLQLMEIALKDTERLSQFVSDFLRFARPLPPRREWIDLQKLLYETVQLIQNDLEATRRVKVSLAKSPEPILSFIDPNQLKQVFWNLGNNAFQAMPAGGTLSLSTRRIGSRGKETVAEILIEDSGEGISSEDLPHIFEPFFTTKSAGSGLGLAIVQRIIEEHFGRITVESQPGKTRFCITLPINASEAWDLDVTTEHRSGSVDYDSVLERSEQVVKK